MISFGITSIVGGPQNGLYRPASDYGDGYAILRIDSFYDGCISDEAELKRVRLDADEAARYELRLGDLLINRVNSVDFVGKCAIIETLHEPTVFESNIMRFSVDVEEVDPRYLVRWMCLDPFRSHILARAKSAISQVSVNQEDIRCTIIPLPPLRTQKILLERAMGFEDTATASFRNISALSNLSATLTNFLMAQS